MSDRPRDPQRSGILPVEKGPGVTSFQVVAHLRRILRAPRIGHGGTLDPAATGLLPILLGEATKLTDLKSAVRSMRWADDSSRIFFSADEPLTDAQKQSRKEGDDSVFVDEGPNGQTRASFSNLWVIAVADKQARQLTTGDRVIGDFAPSPDGARIAYISRPNNRRNHQNKAEVFVLDVASSSAKQLTASAAESIRPAKRRAT